MFERNLARTVWKITTTTPVLNSRNWAQVSLGRTLLTSSFPRARHTSATGSDQPEPLGTIGTIGTKMSATTTSARSSSSSTATGPPSSTATGPPSSTATGPPSSISIKKSKEKFKLTLKTINPFVKNMEYAVRGKMPQEAAKIESAIKKGSGDYSFKQVLHCNIGDCHAMGQKPLTFVRQLLAACTCPWELGKGVYPSDVEERAHIILDHCGGKSIGAYSESRGIKIIRKHVAEFISERDGFPCSHENIYLVNGASEGIKNMLFIIMGNLEEEDRKTGIMVPLPQYPLYSAAIAQLNAKKISYQLNEENNWGIDINNLRNDLYNARKKCEPRVMVVINPGNPTGQYLPLDNMKEIIKFCHEEGLLLFTDEVYQENVYVKPKFHSFRKVLHEMGKEYSDLQMVSFNSTSKGFFGECGIRGGYMHIRGMDEEVMKQIYKNASVNLCPNTPGQIVTDALVKRPLPGDPSHDLYQKELDLVLRELADKAVLIHVELNAIPGVKCSKIQGAMYAYPRVDIPEEAWEDARKEDPTMELDMYYCLEFLRQQGVCVVPGSGFGKLDGRWYFRTTILPPRDKLEEMLKRFREFHTNFLRKYGRDV